MEFKRNKKAFFDYHHLETLEAGIALTGAEVRAVKSGLINLEGSYVTIADGQAWLVGCHIAAYPKASLARAGYRPDRKRRLLLHKKELMHLAGLLMSRGLTIVPLSVYSSKRLIKIKVAVARGKRSFDKRAAIKEKDYRRRLNSRVR